MAKLLAANHVFSPALPPAAVAAFRKLADASNANIGALLATVEYPKDGVGPRADDLTPAQRAVVELITELDLQTNDNDIDQWMPRRQADRRSWLGLDPAQPLDRPYAITIGKRRSTEPGWRALKLLRQAENNGADGVVEAWLAKLPVADRLAMWGQINLDWPQPWDLQEDDFFDPSDPALVDGLGAEGKTWAPAYADRWLAVHGDDETKVAPLWPLLAIVRAKLPVEPRWDALLPGNGYAETGEILDALPVERRGPALRGLLKRMPHPASVVSTAKALLARAPDAEAMTYVIACLPFASGATSKHLEALAKAAHDHPAMLAIVQAAQGKRPTGIRLRTLAFRDVSNEGASARFTELDEAQLLAAGRLYFGKKVPLARLLDLEPEHELSLRAVLTYYALADASATHAYDVWTYAGDSGTVFAAGTTNHVASIIQGSVDGLRDAALVDALEVALRERPSSKKKKAGGQTEAKKTAVKKAAVKKAAAKAKGGAAKKKPTSAKAAAGQTANKRRPPR